MDDYKIIVEQEHQTVMAHYEVEPKPAEGYQSEAALEASLIKQLQGQGYEYAHIKDEAGLLKNLRHQLELLNEVVLSDSEWNRLLPMISNEQMTIVDKTEMIQGKGYVLNLTLDNGLTKNIKLIDNGRRRFVEFSKSPRTDPNIDNPDVVPLNRQTRAYIEKTVLEQYDSYEGGGIGT